jgi:hypothetical protein
MIEPGPSVFLGGVETSTDQVAVIAAGGSYNWRFSGATHWGAVSLLKQKTDMLYGATAGIRARPVVSASVFVPSPMALAHLHSVHNRIGRLAETTLELFTNTDRSRDLAQDLISAAQNLRNTQESGSNSTRRRHHRIVTTRFRKVLAAQPDMPGRMAEISGLIGVSSGTLPISLPGRTWDESYSVCHPMPSVVSARCAAESQSRGCPRNRGCDGTQFLGARPVCREMPTRLWRVAVGDPEMAP